MLKFFNLSLPLLLILVVINPRSAAYADSSLPVVVEAVRKQPIFQSIFLTGSVTSAQQSKLSTATSGLVDLVAVEEGTNVKAGQILLKLDNELTLEQWYSAQAKAEQANIAHQDAVRRLNEARTLTLKNSIAETMVRSLESEVAATKALEKQALAEAQFQKALLDRHTLKAPFEGIISQKFATKGEWVVPGQAVFELVAVDNLRLDFAVAEEYLSRINADTLVSFWLAANPEKIVKGHIGTLVPISTPGSRTFLLRIPIENADNTTIPGMSVQAKLELATGRDGLVVPKDATLRYPDGRQVVWTVDKINGALIAKQNRVQTGESFGDYIEIREGIAKDSQVIVKGNEALQSGQQIYILSSRKPEK